MAAVQIGAVFPQTEIGTDPGAIRAYAQAVEAMGFSHLLTYDHVLGANVARPDRQAQRWAYTIEDQFHEPFVLFGYLAATTQRLGLATGVIILPQRQTALVAKQAAAVDVLSAGRLRLGVGIGWNAIEYEALGEDFHNRGRRFAEQIAVLRALWTQPSVTFHGRWHHIDEAGLNPLPVQRPIPLWIGGAQAPGEAPVSVLRRIGELADGWVLTRTPAPDIETKWNRIKEFARQAGRDPAQLGLEGAIRYRDGTPETWRQALVAWEQLGATHVSINTMGAGLHAADGHVEALRRVKEALAH